MCFGTELLPLVYVKVYRENSVIGCWTKSEHEFSVVINDPQTNVIVLKPGILCTSEHFCSSQTTNKNKKKQQTQ